VKGNVDGYTTAEAKSPNSKIRKETNSMSFRIQFVAIDDYTSVTISTGKPFGAVRLPPNSGVFPSKISPSITPYT
jgi:hypothetical protein